jgi:hypothetical protein
MLHGSSSNLGREALGSNLGRISPAKDERMRTTRKFRLSLR